MPREFARAQQEQNHAFLAILRRTGNTRLAARELGMHRATFTRRRRKHAAFAAEWDAALTIAHAALQLAAKGAEVTRCGAQRAEPRVTRLGNGKFQLRVPARRQLDRAAEQAFLAALSATADIRLSAAAAGFSHSAFYQRRKQCPAFAREMRLALQMGYDRIELALLEGFDPASHRDDAWRSNDPPPIPQMTASQALQLLYLHQKEARLGGDEPPEIKRRRGEPENAHWERLLVMHEQRRQRQRETFYIAETERRVRDEPSGFGPRELPPLPALNQVTGWSKADPDLVPTDADRALFGGWRLKDWKR